MALVTLAVMDDQAGSGHQTTFSTGAVVAAVVVVLAAIGAVGWGAAAAVGSAHAQSEFVASQPLVRAEPASYHPAIVANAAAASIETFPHGNWTPEKGRLIAQRALYWRNWPYAFGGGGPDGPSFGVAVDKDSANDNKVRGFDCSGLAMYAMAPFMTNLKHDAAAQYVEVGHWHPALDSLEIGDLIFWSANGTIGGIGHVAIYIGDGMVVQAPHSGDVVRVTPIYQVESGDMGATRPLT
jgi:cell wall-associated NlpC family hydrolase